MDSFPHFIAFQHDIYLVALSFTVCLGASATALRLMMFGARSTQFRTGFLMFGGACGGAGAWATSFIALLSFQPGYDVGYDGPAVVASLIIPIVGGALGVLSTFRTPRPWNIPAWGLIFAAGVGLTNYIGLVAIEVGGRLSIAPGSIGASMVSGVLFSMLAMRLGLRARSALRAAAAATAMAVAIFSMHFIMVIGLTVIPDARHYVAESESSRRMLAAAVAALTAILAFVALTCIWLRARARQRSHRLLLAVVEAMPHSLAYFDRDDRYVLGNSQYERELVLIGLQPKVGLRYVDILERLVERDHAALDVDERRRWIEGRLAERAQQTCEFDQALPDGRHLRSQSKRTGEGGVVTVISDITGLRRQAQELAHARDQAEAATRAKSQFLATMSHEIRTPLNGVLGMTQAMASDRLPRIQRGRLDVIRQSGEALLGVLNDVLDFSKIEAGKLEIEVRDFDLVPMVKAAHQAFTAVADAKGLEFAFDIEQLAGGRYRGDPTRVRQVLGNLLSNALKFTEKGRVDLCVRASGEGLVFSVSDSGIGMNPDQLSGLFEKFTQADASTTRRFGGTGLGLAICRDLAALMGGSIAVQSRIGVGSTFSFALPLQRLGDESDVAAGATALNAPADAELRVLAAEDNRVNQLVLKTLLAQAGIVPVVVENGLQAVDAWQTGEWDLILMDVQMPQMDGPAAAREIRARETLHGRLRTPIIALTANAMAHQLRDYVDAGMDGFVAKPIETAKLFGAIEEVLSKGPAEEPAADGAAGCGS